MKDLSKLPPGTIVHMSEEEMMARAQRSMLSPVAPAQEIAHASAIATQLASIIETKKLYKQIGKKKHVYVEGWTAVAALRGVTPLEISNERQEDGSYIAKVSLVNADGRTIGAASAECGGPEEMLWQERAPYARRSMAATRATSKVCRLCFSWILVLEGYSGTPAEEMDGIAAATKQQKATGKPQAAQKQPSGGYTGGWDGNLVIKSGKNKGKKWSELPSHFLDWTQSGKAEGTIVEMGAKELARRAQAEAAHSNRTDAEMDDDAMEGADAYVDADITREPGGDDDLPVEPPRSEDPRYA